MELDKSGRHVQAMFGAIAGRYDLLNHVLSGYQDIYWRRRAVRQLCPRPSELVLDLCCGTGDLSFELARRQPRCRIIGADFTVPMLELAREKEPGAAPRDRPEGHDRPKPGIGWLAADGLQLPFESGTFDAVCAGFGVRNFSDTVKGVEEMVRVLKPGGRLMVLEFMRPVAPPVVAMMAVFQRCSGHLGRWISGQEAAYRYLPASIGGFWSAREFEALLVKGGLGDVRYFHFSGGIATAFLARKPRTGTVPVAGPADFEFQEKNIKLA